jgi:Zn finger protein HypA/HybF involved in hydrogenase expression
MVDQVARYGILKAVINRVEDHMRNHPAATITTVTLSEHAVEIVVTEPMGAIGPVVTHFTVALG